MQKFLKKRGTVDQIVIEEGILRPPPAPVVLPAVVLPAVVPPAVVPPAVPMFVPLPARGSLGLSIYFSKSRMQMLIRPVRRFNRGKYLFFNSLYFS